ncbi:MAG: hypothetical protein RL518_2425 [Pseudomonadota bacterium]
MIRAVPCILVGAVLGSIATWGVYGRVAPSIPSPGPSSTPLTCDAEEVARLKLRVEQLEKERGHLVSSVPSPLAGGPARIPEREGEGENVASSTETLSWRISAIEKFVPLTPEQKERLREKYERESAARGSGEEVETESLDDILGAENASYYREQVQAAFRRVQNEEIERESVWLSRKLGLTAEQESSVRQLFERVESEVSEAQDHGQARGSPQERVQQLIAENRRRSELRNAELARVLSPEQFKTYVQLEAQSSTSDVEVFHDPGPMQGTPASP